MTNKDFFKRTFLAFFLFMLTTMSWASLAYDFEVDGIYYKKNSDGISVSVTSEIVGFPYYYDSSRPSGDIVIPPSVTYNDKTYSVTSIGGDAFIFCSSLTSIEIPNSVTSIGKYAFYDCTSLTEVTIPNSVTEIGERAFQDCTGLTEVTIPNSVTSIGEYAFDRCI